MKNISQHRENSSPSNSFRSKKVIYLIGLPGVGKATVANAIAIKTGFVSIDHNLTYVEICHFLKRGTVAAHRLNGRIHLAILKLLLNSKISGVVCTMSSRRNPTLQIAKNTVKVLKNMGVQVSFVKLECDWRENKRRIKMSSRKKLKKPNTINKLKKYTEMPCFEGLKAYPPLVINNTKMSANECAEKIITALKIN
jgi:adenylate kinase family enzyme